MMMIMVMTYFLSSIPQIAIEKYIEEKKQMWKGMTESNLCGTWRARLSVLLLLCPRCSLSLIWTFVQKPVIVEQSSLETRSLTHPSQKSVPCEGPEHVMMMHFKCWLVRYHVQLCICPLGRTKNNKDRQALPWPDHTHNHTGSRILVYEECQFFSAVATFSKSINVWPVQNGAIWVVLRKENWQSGFSLQCFSTSWSQAELH